MSSKHANKRANLRFLNELSELPDVAELGAGEAALFIGRSVETLRRWRNRGIGPTYLRATAREDHATYTVGHLRAFQRSRTVELGLKNERPDRGAS